MGKGTRHSPASQAFRRESSSRAKVYHRAELASSRLSQRAPAPAPNLARVSSGSDWHLRAKDTRPGLSSAFAAENSWQRLWRGGSLRFSPFGSKSFSNLRCEKKKQSTGECSLDRDVDRGEGRNNFHEDLASAGDDSSPCFLDLIWVSLTDIEHQEQGRQRAEQDAFHVDNLEDLVAEQGNLIRELEGKVQDLTEENVALESALRAYEQMEQDRVESWDMLRHIFLLVCTLTHSLTHSLTTHSLSSALSLF